MDIVINLQPIKEFLFLPEDEMLLKLFLTIGWLPIAITFIWGTIIVWRYHIRDKWAEGVH